jgi:hypothetical protein
VILLRGEWFLGFSGGACLAFLLYGENLFARLTEPAWLALIFVWLFTAALAVGHSALRGRAFRGVPPQACFTRVLPEAKPAMPNSGLPMRARNSAWSV